MTPFQLMKTHEKKTLPFPLLYLHKMSHDIGMGANGNGTLSHFVIFVTKKNTLGSIFKMTLQNLLMTLTMTMTKLSKVIPKRELVVYFLFHHYYNHKHNIKSYQLYFT